MISEEVIIGPNLRIDTLYSLSELLVAVSDLFLINGEEAELVEKEVFCNIVWGPFCCSLLLDHLLWLLSFFIYHINILEFYKNSILHKSVAIFKGCTSASHFRPGVLAPKPEIN